MSKLTLDLPDGLLNGMSTEQAQTLALEAFLVKFYDLGEISSGRAAEILGVTRRDFLDTLGKYNVSIFDPNMDLEAELRNSELAERGNRE